MTKIGIILGSTRPGRNGEAVANWVLENASQRQDAQYELVDIADYDLPLLDEPMPAMMVQYSQDHTKRWSEKISSFDGFVIVTAEYNHGVPGALKNAIDFLNVEWNNKAVGFVGYGTAGGVRAVEQLRLISGEVRMADVRSQVALSMFTDFEQMRNFSPADLHLASLNATFDDVVSWSNALEPLRAG
jgi:NAD(P)H-dependent FMN reductase